MAPSFHMTHIGTATALLNIAGLNFITDPFFSPAGSNWDLGFVSVSVSDDPALGLHQLPPIDAVLLSHEDHIDNLDDYGRRLLDGRHVFTTMDGAKNLAPRPGVQGFRAWETRQCSLGGKTFTLTATPCQHLPGGECTGFLLHHADFGCTDGKPNAIWFAGDTVYIPELKAIKDMYHVTAAVLSLGAAHAPEPVAGRNSEKVQITMDGRQAARIFREIGAEKLVPMHFESWSHFTQGGSELKRVFEEEGVAEKVCWLKPGEAVKVF